MVELKLIIDALQSIDSLSDVSDQSESRQSTYIQLYPVLVDLLGMVWGSVSYGKKYSEGYPKIFVTAVQLYLGTSTVYGTTSSSRSGLARELIYQVISAPVRG